MVRLLSNGIWSIYRWWKLWSVRFPLATVKKRHNYKSYQFEWISVCLLRYIGLLFFWYESDKLQANELLRNIFTQKLVFDKADDPLIIPNLPEGRSNIHSDWFINCHLLREHKLVLIYLRIHISVLVFERGSTVADPLPHNRLRFVWCVTHPNVSSDEMESYMVDIPTFTLTKTKLIFEE